MAWENARVSPQYQGFLNNMSIVNLGNNYTEFYNDRAAALAAFNNYISGGVHLSQIADNTYLFGDSQSGCTKLTSGTPQVELRYNNEIVAVNTQSIANTGDFAVPVFLINEATQQGAIYLAQVVGLAGGYFFYFQKENYLTNNGYYKLYQLFSGHIVPEYTWHSFGGVTGSLGQFNFTMVKDDYIDDSAPVYDLTPDDMEQICSQTDINNLGRDLPSGEETIVIFAGKTNNLRLTYNYTNTQYTIAFYTSAEEISPFYSITVNENTLPSYLGFIIDNDAEVAKFSIIQQVDSAGFTRYQTRFDVSMTDTQMHLLYIWLNSHSADPGDNEEVEDEPTDPWYETPITGLTEPSISAIATGFTKMYEVTDTNLKALSDFLWSSSFIDNVKKFFEDPREIIVGLSIMPVKPTVGGAETIQAGGISTGVSGLPLTKQYKLETYGSIYIKKSKGNFLDYPPYTKITACLPFVGEHDLDVNRVMGHTLTLKYIFDFLTGSCIAEIDVDDKPTYFFGGSCGIQVPTSSEDFSRQFSSIISAGATLGATMATIASGGMTAPLAFGAATNMIANGMNMAPKVQYTSGNGAVNGMLSCQSAYLIIETPNDKLADDSDLNTQQSFIGRTSLLNRQLSSCSGFTKCMKVHLNGLNCTTQEYNEIMSNLLNGVIIQEGSTLPDVTPTTTGDTVIMFLKMSSEHDVIGKTFDEVNYLKLEGKLVQNQSMLNPQFIIEGDVTDYNYAYIPMFERYYYITDIVCNSMSLETVSFSVDALNSWQTDILNCRAIVERQESKYNAQMNDPNYWTLQSKTVLIKPFLDGSKNELVFDRDHNTFILTIAGA